MKKIFLFFGIGFCFLFQGAFVNAQKPPIGTWRDHLSHKLVKKIAYAGTRIYAGGDAGLFYYDREDYSMNRMTSLQGFSDVGVDFMAYNKHKDALVIVYQNANIDLYIDDVIYNISDLKRKSISTSKEVYDITFEGQYAYLACHFGIVVVDLTRKEIKDIYTFGENSGYIKVNTVAFNDTSIFAATETGIYYADKKNPLLADFQNWTHSDDPLFNGDTTDVTDLKVFHNKLLISLKPTHQTDTFSYYHSTESGEWEYIGAFPRKYTQVVNKKLFIINQKSVEVFDENFQKIYSLVTENPCTIDMIDGRIGDDNSFWMAHSWDGFSFLPRYNTNPCYTILTPPTSPETADVYKMIYNKGDMYLISGNHTSNTYIHGTVNNYSSNTWRSIPTYHFENILYNYLDLAVEPKNKNHFYVASAHSGIIEVKDNATVAIWDDKNTGGALGRYISDTSANAFSSLFMVGIEFDEEGNLWAIQSRQNNALSVRYKDGTWRNFETQRFLPNEDNDNLKGLLISNQTNYKWFWSSNNLIYAHDGKNQFGFINPNEGNELRSSSLNCIAEDQNGTLYVGTDRGIKALYHSSNIFQNQEISGKLPIYLSTFTMKEEDSDTRYLLENTTVNCISIDGKNRKWVGTQLAGVFLFSENMDKQVLNFTIENSPLYSNTILDIEINSESGEIFIVTDKGVISYVGQATEGKELFTNIYAYPNPVKSDYRGSIAIKGLIKDALVHITDVSGNVVFTTQSYGGQAIWDGNNLSGQRVATGVYLIFVADKTGEERSVTKLLFLK